ncbi:MAG: hypothetical protein AAGB46_00525 [Verrucomicrobiota bacterium]
MFLANSFLFAAAAPCSGDSSQVFAESEAMSACHGSSCDSNADETRASEEGAFCCDGICLCFHASVSQVLELKEALVFSARVVVLDYLDSRDDAMLSRSVSPLRRPPKYLS